MNTVTRERLEELRSLVLMEMPDGFGARVMDRGEELGSKHLKNGADVARLFLYALALSSGEDARVEVPARPVFFAQLDYEKGGEPSLLNPTDFIEDVARLQLQVAETRQAVHVFDSRQYVSADGLTLDCVLLGYNPKAHAILCKYGAIQPAGGSPQATAGDSEEQGEGE